MAAYVARLIDRVRRETGNREHSFGFHGLNDLFFLDKLNDAQDRLQSLLVPIAPELFAQTQIIPLTPWSNAYDLDGECFPDREISVFFSSDSQIENYVPIPAVSELEISMERDDNIVGYTIGNNGIIVTPTPLTGTGSLLVNYSRELRDLSTRVGTINTNNATSITLNAVPTPNLETILSETNVFIGDYLCVVNDAGDVQNSAIVTTNYVTATRVFTAAVGVGVVLPVNAWVVMGKYATTHTEGPRNWDRYLVSYAVRMILSRDESSADFMDEDPILQAIESDIIQQAESLKGRVMRPPLLNGYFR